MSTTANRRRIHQVLSVWLPLVLWMALIFWLSCQPALPDPADMLSLPDDLINYPAHALEFAVLALLAWRARNSWAAGRPASSSLSSLVHAGLFSAVYAASDEMHQWFVPGRESSLADWLADAVGIAITIGLVLWRQRVRD